MMAVIERPVAYRVDIIERERGYGAKLDQTMYFDNEEEARNYVQTFNARNTAKTAPDWYMVAEYRGLV
jgi:hypothetical protein